MRVPDGFEAVEGPGGRPVRTKLRHVATGAYIVTAGPATGRTGAARGQRWRIVGTDETASLGEIRAYLDGCSGAAMTPREFVRRDAARRIAERHGYGDLLERKSDRADFREVHVVTMREALGDAFDAGREFAERRARVALRDVLDLLENGAGPRNMYAVRAVRDALEALEAEGGGA